MRILLLTQLFQPEPNHLKGLAFAQELMRQGHEVEVLTGFPNYPGGKLYPGYRMRLFQRERIGGIDVLRIPSYLSHDRSGLRRLLSYFSFALSAMCWGVFKVRRPDVVHVYQGSATLALPAMILRLLRGVPYVLDVQDLWPESVTGSGMLRFPFGEALLNVWCRLTYKLAARIVVLSPGYKLAIASRGTPADKIEVVYNWCDETQPRPPLLHLQAVCPFLRKDSFNIVYAGNMGKLQALAAVIQAADILKDDVPRIQFVLIGDGVELMSLKEKASSLKLANVHFVPRQAPEHIGAILQQADLLLVHLRDTPLGRVGIPQKTQAYLASGRPVLMAMAGDGAELVLNAHAGVACEPEKPESIAAAIREVVNMPVGERNAMAERGRRFYESELSFSVGTARMLSVFEAAKERLA
jgi:glycosyltransferase involved in cell wall biosynthesis